MTWASLGSFREARFALLAREQRRTLAQLASSIRHLGKLRSVRSGALRLLARV